MSTFEQLGSFADALVGQQADYYDRTERLNAEIRDIISKRRFGPVFQPFVDLVTGDVVGYEALTRFDDGESPERRFVAAHSVGLGSALEASCVVAAIEASSSLPPEIWLSVNFSPTAIVDGTVAGVVAGINRSIVVEITEHAIVEDYGAVRRAVAAMPGVRLAVDDAGAGFTSLTHIIELEPAFVKLDISIVRDIDRDRVRQAMAAAMAYFAAESNATIIAEGVETEAEADTLRALAATIGGRRMLGQGFLFGRPAAFD
jgi:EAL domain-containing protein (putative c-di-GMP-specific phosphodiesterase class I)